ncbi:hypothetical protein LCGC14_2643770, partial [marine sediment metagenome]
QVFTPEIFKDPPPSKGDGDALVD